MSYIGETVAASPVASSTVWAAASTSIIAGWVSRNNEVRPTGSEPTRPHSRRQARRLEAVDCASPTACTTSTTRAGPAANRRTIASPGWDLRAHETVPPLAPAVPAASLQARPPSPLAML